MRDIWKIKVWVCEGGGELLVEEWEWRDLPVKCCWSVTVGSQFPVVTAQITSRPDDDLGEQTFYSLSQLLSYSDIFIYKDIICIKQ